MRESWEKIRNCFNRLGFERSFAGQTTARILYVAMFSVTTMAAERTVHVVGGPRPKAEQTPVYCAAPVEAVARELGVLRQSAQSIERELFLNRSLSNKADPADNSAYFIPSVDDAVRFGKKKDDFDPLSRRKLSTETDLAALSRMFTTTFSDLDYLLPKFRAGIVLAAYDCPKDSVFQKSLKEFLEKRTGQTDGITREQREIWLAFQKALSEAEEFQSFHEKSREVMDAIHLDLRANLSRFMGTLENDQPTESNLMKYAVELYEKVKSKQLKTIGDLKKAAAGNPAHLALYDLLFVPGHQGLPVADLILGKYKANVLRNTILMGPVKIVAANDKASKAEIFWPRSKEPSSEMGKRVEAIAAHRLFQARPDYPALEKDFEQVLGQTQALTPEERQKTRVHLQNLLKDLSEKPLKSREGFTSENLREQTERYRTFLTQAIRSIDENSPLPRKRGLPDDDAPAPSHRAAACDGDDCRQVMKLPKTGSGESIQVPKPEGEETAAAPKKEVPLPKAPVPHALYGRDLADERELPYSDDIKKIAAELSKAVSLTPEDREAITHLKRSSIALLLGMAENAKLRDKIQPGEGGIRSNFVLSAEDLRDLIRKKPPADDLIFSHALLSRMNKPGNDSALLRFLANKFEASPVAGLDIEKFKPIIKAVRTKENVGPLVQSLLTEVEKQLDNPRNISSEQKDYLLMTAAVLREWAQKPESLLVAAPGVPPTVAAFTPQYTASALNVGHAERRAIDKALADPKKAAEMAPIKAAREWLRNTYAHDGKGLPMGTELGLTKLFGTGNPQLFDLAKSLHGQAPSEGFHEILSSVKPDIASATAGLNAALQTYSPQAHYLAGDANIAFQRLYGELLHSTYSNGKVDPDILSRANEMLKMRLLMKGEAAAKCVLGAGENSPVEERVGCLRELFSDEQMLFGSCMINEKAGDIATDEMRLACLKNEAIRAAARVAIKENKNDKARALLEGHFGKSTIVGEMSQARLRLDQEAEILKAGLTSQNLENAEKSASRPFQLSENILRGQAEEQAKWLRFQQEEVFKQQEQLQNLNSQHAARLKAVEEAAKNVEEQKQKLEKAPPAQKTAREKELKKAEENLEGEKLQLENFINNDRRQALNLLRAISDVNPQEARAGMSEDEMVAHVDAMLKSDEFKPTLGAIYNNYVGTGKSAINDKDGNPVEFPLEKLVELVSTYRKTQARAGGETPLSQQVKEMANKCQAGTEKECPLACGEEDPKELCEAKKGLREELLEVSKKDNLDRRSIRTDKEEGTNEHFENLRIARGLVEKLTAQSARDTLQQRLQEDYDTLSGQVQEALTSNEKLQRAGFTPGEITSEVLHSRQFIEWGHALADSAVASNQPLSKMPDPKSADYHAQAKRWVENAGLKKSVDDWIFMAKSGAYPIGVGTDPEKYFYDEMLKNIFDREYEKRERVAEIEKEMEPVIAPSGSQNPAGALWNWDKANLSRLAPEFGVGATKTGSAEELRANGHVMTQGKFRELLDEYANLKALPQLGLHPNYTKAGTGSTEFDNLVYNNLLQSPSSRAVSVSSVAAATVGTKAGEDGKEHTVFNFVDLKKVVPQVERDLSEVQEYVIRNGPLHQAILASGRWKEGWGRIGLAIDNGARLWSDIDSEVLYTQNDRKVREMGDKLLRTIDQLEALGTTKIKLRDRDTGLYEEHEASTIAKDLRNKLMSSIAPDERAVDQQIVDGYQRMARRAIPEATVTAGLYLASGPLGWLAGTARVKNALAAAEGWRGFNLASKAYSVGKGFYGRGMLPIKGALYGTGIIAPYAGYNHYQIHQGRKTADAIDKLGADGRPGANGIPDWQDALKAGRSYAFDKDGGLTLTQVKVFDRDNNGVPDDYEYQQDPTRLTELYLGDLGQFHESLENGALMGVGGGIGVIVPKTIGKLGSLAGVGKIFGQRGKLAWGMSENFMGQMTAQLAIKAARSDDALETLTSKDTYVDAGFQSLYMAPADDLLSAWYVGRTMRKLKAAGQELTPAVQATMLKNVNIIKSLINHVGQDGGQGFMEVWRNGAYQTRTGEQIEEGWKAALASIFESYYQSRRASRPNDAVTDLMPRFAELQLLSQGKSDLLDLELVLPDGRGQKQSRSVRSILGSTANLDQYVGKPNGVEALTNIFRERFLEAGIKEADATRAIEEGIAKLFPGEKYMTEAKDFISDAIEREKNKALVDGRMKFENVQTDTRDYHSEKFHPFKLPPVKGKRIGDYAPVTTQGYHRIRVSDAGTDGSNKARNPELQKAIYQVAADYGLNRYLFERAVLAEFTAKRDPGMTLGQFARRLKSQREPERFRGKLGDLNPTAR